MTSFQYNATGMCGRLVMIILIGRVVVGSHKRYCSWFQSSNRDPSSHSSTDVSYSFRFI